MSLRRILLVLSLLAFLSATTGGVLYFTALYRSALREADRQALANVELIRKSLNSFLSEHRKPAATLATIPETKLALLSNDPDILHKANITLDRFTLTLDADVCYLMNRQGITIASSNRRAPDSFVGKNFSFRPYFKQAVLGQQGSYLALGTTSGKRGVYHSHPVWDDPDAPPIGVAVIKSSIEKTEKQLGLPSEDVVLVISPQGVIFISNRAEWLFQLAWKVADDEMAHIADHRQFGRGPWHWIGMRRIDNRHVADRQNQRYLMHQMALDFYEGWQVVYLRDMQQISQSISAPLFRIVGPVVLLLSVLIGISVVVLYQKASGEIRRRRSAEQALRESENRYRSLYHHTPAMLHSIDTEGRLLSVSDYWAETMGYCREEVVGRPLTDFLTPEAGSHARKAVFPQFFRDGFCKDINYQFVKKNGDIIEASMSAIADRDSRGRIQRSMAVSIDVTQRNRAEEALRLAKEELSRYSRELERQVSVRTGEINALLKYSPNVVYIKDTQCRYRLVNTRYEKLFGVQNAAIYGKTDEEVLPPALARQFRMNDERALAENRFINMEEQIPQADGNHIYLSVKFPIYDEPGGEPGGEPGDESGNVRGVCGIATDITPLKKAQEQLRRLSGSIMANQEKERSAIARELHDELGQLLTALRMDAVWLQERLKENDSKAAGRAGAMCTLIDTTIEGVRDMAVRLRPGVLDDLGLVEALDFFTTEFERRGPIACIFNHKNIPDVDETISTVAYRIAQEALTNVARHAEATRVEVGLSVDDGHLILNVSDDGRGFEPEKVLEGKALGLDGMHERAALVGGELTITSRIGGGTLVRLRVPLPA
jgi:PAS domain S-box-containing protein